MTSATTSSMTSPSLSSTTLALGQYQSGTAATTTSTFAGSTSSGLFVNLPMAQIITVKLNQDNYLLWKIKSSPSFTATKSWGMSMDRTLHRRCSSQRQRRPVLPWWPTLRLSLIHI